MSFSRQGPHRLLSNTGPALLPDSDYQDIGSIFEVDDFSCCVSQASLSPDLPHRWPLQLALTCLPIPEGNPLVEDVAGVQELF